MRKSTSRSLFLAATLIAPLALAGTPAQAVVSCVTSPGVVVT